MAFVEEQIELIVGLFGLLGYIMAFIGVWIIIKTNKKIKRYTFPLLYLASVFLVSLIFGFIMIYTFGFLLASDFAVLSLPFVSYFLIRVFAKPKKETKKKK